MHVLRLVYVLFLCPCSPPEFRWALRPWDVDLKELEDFYMTDSISRASQTMAKCVTVVQADRAKNTL